MNKELPVFKMNFKKFCIAVLIFIWRNNFKLSQVIIIFLHAVTIDYKRFNKFGDGDC